MANRKRTVLDEVGNKYTISEAAETLGMPYGTIYEYVVKDKCKTLSDILKVQKEKKNTNPFDNVGNATHDTKFGKLTLREIFRLHPYRRNVTIPLLTSRLCSHGGMSEKIWEDRKVVSRKQTTPTTREFGDLTKLSSASRSNRLSDIASPSEYEMNL